MTTFVEFIDRLIDVKTQSRDQMAGELRQTGRIFPIDGFKITIITSIIVIIVLWYYCYCYYCYYYSYYYC